MYGIVYKLSRDPAGWQLAKAIDKKRGIKPKVGDLIAVNASFTLLKKINLLY